MIRDTFWDICSRRILSRRGRAPDGLPTTKEAGTGP
jgi:hypothetical protein